MVTSSPPSSSIWRGNFLTWGDSFIFSHKKLSSYSLPRPRANWSLLRSHFLLLSSSSSLLPLQSLWSNSYNLTMAIPSSGTWNKVLLWTRELFLLLHFLMTVSFLWDSSFPNHKPQTANDPLSTYLHSVSSCFVALVTVSNYLIVLLVYLQN